MSLVPKIGPLRVLQLQTPTPEAERIFETSFNASLIRYQKLLDGVAAGGKVDLPNDNFDTGEVTGPGVYRLNDEAQAELLDALAKQGFSGTPSGVGMEVLAFFSDPSASYSMKGKPKEWMKIQAELEQLKGKRRRRLGTSVRTCGAECQATNRATRSSLAPRAIHVFGLSQATRTCLAAVATRRVCCADGPRHRPAPYELASAATRRYEACYKRVNLRYPSSSP